MVKIDNNKIGYDLLNTIKDVVHNYIGSKAKDERCYLKLESVKPLIFRNTVNDIEVKGNMLITPRYRVFKTEEVGTMFMFLKTDDANKYIYLYETAFPGSNGERYTDEAEILETYDGEHKLVTGGKIVRDGGGW